MEASILGWVAWRRTLRSVTVKIAGSCCGMRGPCVVALIGDALADGPPRNLALAPEAPGVVICPIGPATPKSNPVDSQRKAVWLPTSVHLIVIIPIIAQAHDHHNIKICPSQGRARCNTTSCGCNERNENNLFLHEGMEEGGGRKEWGL